MKKFLIVLLCLLLVLGIGGYFGYRYVLDTYLVMDGEFIRRDVTALDLTEDDLAELEKVTELHNLKMLDLRGTSLTTEQYDWLRAELPDCEIRWMIPFQGKRYHQTDSALSISSITPEEMEDLAYFENLTTIDATAMTDLETVMALQDMYPQVEIAYQVAVGGQMLGKDATALTVENADLTELEEKLQYLPAMADITFTGTVPENEAIYGFMQNWPGITCHWDFTFLGMAVSSDTAEIDISGMGMDSMAELEAGLKYFNHLEKVVMCDTGLPSQEIDDLWKRHPETRFIWNVWIGECNLRTDTTAFIPYTFGYTGVASDPNEKLHRDDFAEMKYLVDMVCMDLGHMRPGDISFVSYMPNLEYLLLCDTEIRDISPIANCKKLKYLELFSNSISDFSPLAGCTALEDVNLGFNPIKDISGLYELENLKNIWITGFSLKKEQRQMLEESHPDARIVYATVSAVCDGWRELPNYYKQRDLLGMFYMKDDA